MGFEISGEPQAAKKEGAKKERDIGAYVKGAFLGAALSMGHQAWAESPTEVAEKTIEKKEQVKKRMFSGEILDPTYGRITVEVSEVDGSGSFTEGARVEVLINGQERKIVRFEVRRDGGTRVIDLDSAKEEERASLYFPSPERKEQATYRFVDAQSGQEVTLPLNITYSFRK